jgi:tetratricopeptide (TPR) repeat protein
MFWLIVLAQLGGQPVGSRPAECGALDGGKAANVWERAKAPELRAYCDLLASGSAKLAGGQGAQGVLPIADEADKKVPGRLAPSVLRGRAYEKLHRYDDAFATLSAVRAKDPSAVEEAFALLAFARAAMRTNHPKEAADAYRALLPRAVALSPSERAGAYVEAGFVAMARGPGGLDEAIAIFRQARKDAQDVSQSVAWLGLALALDRNGNRDEAKAVLGERTKFDPRPALAEARTRDVLAPTFAAESDAMSAVALETSDVAAAREAYKRYADVAGQGPWADHARAAEAALGGKRKR